MTLRWLRVVPQVDRPHRNANSFRLSIEEAAGSHVSNLVAQLKHAPLHAETEQGAG